MATKQKNKPRSVYENRDVQHRWEMTREAVDRLRDILEEEGNGNDLQAERDEIFDSLDQMAVAAGFEQP